jgi:hypothetical protein
LSTVIRYVTVQSLPPAGTASTNDLMRVGRVGVEHAVSTVSTPATVIVAELRNPFVPPSASHRAGSDPIAPSATAATTVIV